MKKFHASATAMRGQQKNYEFPIQLLDHDMVSMEIQLRIFAILLF